MSDSSGGKYSMPSGIDEDEAKWMDERIMKTSDPSAAESDTAEEKSPELTKKSLFYAKKIAAPQEKSQKEIKEIDKSREKEY